MNLFLNELYKMAAECSSTDKQPVRNTPAPKKKDMGKAPAGAKGDPAWNDQAQPKQSSGLQAWAEHYQDVMSYHYGR